jgi:hypothetical protein
VNDGRKEFHHCDAASVLFPDLLGMLEMKTEIKGRLGALIFGGATATNGWAVLLGEEYTLSRMSFIYH